MGVLAKVNQVLPLDRYGFDGESVTLWVNFPYSMLKEYWALPTHEKRIEFLIAKGLFQGSSFTQEDGAPLAFEALPWDAQLAATEALMGCLLDRHKTIFRTGSAEDLADKPAEPEKVGG